MNSIQLLREQLKQAHDTQEATIADVSKDSANFNDTNKAIPVGAAYAHSIWGEDMVVSTMLAKKPMLLTNAKEAGLSKMVPEMSQWNKHEEWYKTVEVDIPKMSEFAKKVYKATDDYLATLSDEDLDKIIERPMVGKQNLAYLITNFVILHTANLTGEISAIKGIQGLKGYPF